MSKVPGLENVIRFPLERRIEQASVPPERPAQVMILPVVRYEYDAAPGAGRGRDPRTV
jgi:hypothetical protein